MKDKSIVEAATDLLIENMKDHFIDAIEDAVANEDITENLLALKLVTDEEAGDILVNGLFQSMLKSFDTVFALEENPVSE